LRPWALTTALTGLPVGMVSCAITCPRAASNQATFRRRQSITAHSIAALANRVARFLGRPVVRAHPEDRAVA
jgi:hypothetical protein